MISVQPGRLERFQQRHLENNSSFEIIIVAAVITSTEGRPLCWTSVGAERTDQDRGPRKDGCRYLKVEESSDWEAVQARAREAHPLLDERITTAKAKRHIFRFPKCQRRRSCSADRPSSSGRAWKFSRHELFLLDYSAGQHTLLRDSLFPMLTFPDFEDLMLSTKTHYIGLRRSGARDPSYVDN